MDRARKSRRGSRTVGQYYLFGASTPKSPNVQLRSGHRTTALFIMPAVRGLRQQSGLIAVYRRPRGGVEPRHARSAAAPPSGSLTANLGA